MPNIYLDNNATTSLDTRVLSAIQEELQRGPSNPSSIHTFGRSARIRLNHSRETIASYLNVRPDEILFTSSGTEALNLAIRGIHNEKKILSTRIEHAAVFNTLKQLDQEIHYLPVGPLGHISLIDLETALTHDVGMIVLSAVNNETGIKIPLNAVAALAKDRGIPLILDGVALLGKENFIIPEGVTAMAFSGHKIHAPKGIGCLYLSKGTSLNPLLSGGGQESGLRGGTENLSGIIGFAKAIELLKKELPSATNQMERLRDLLEAELPFAQTVGTGPRICNTSCLTFPNTDGESLLIQLDMAGICASMGSACSAGAIEPSRVLLEMGLSHEETRSTLRFSLSRFTTKSDVLKAAQFLNSLQKQLIN